MGIVSQHKKITGFHKDLCFATQTLGEKMEHCEMLGFIAETNQNKNQIQFLTFRHLPSVAILYCTRDISQKRDQITHASIIKLKVC